MKAPRRAARRARCSSSSSSSCAGLRCTASPSACPSRTTTRSCSHGAPHPEGRAGHHPLEPAIQRRARRLPARPLLCCSPVTTWPSGSYELAVRRAPRRSSSYSSPAVSAGPAAGFAGALLAAWGTPYMALMTATGPPPNFLMPLVTGFPLVAGLRCARAGGVRRSRPVVALRPGRRVRRSRSGTRPWPSRRSRAWRRACCWPACGPRLAARLPLLAGFALGREPARGGPAHPRLRRPGRDGGQRGHRPPPALAVASGIQDLGAALFRLVGLEVPLVVDGPGAQLLPVAARVGLAAGVGAGARLWRCGRDGRCLSWAGRRPSPGRSRCRVARDRTTCATCTA